MKNKKAVERTAIILIIIVFITFAMLLIVFWRTGFFDNTGKIKQACLSSIKARGVWGSREISDVVKSRISLKCETINVCIYKDEKKCNLAGSKNIEYIKVKNKDEVLKAIADKWAESHWMIGEGEYPFVVINKLDKNHCALTHRISFSKELRTEDSIEGWRLIQFMVQNPPNDEYNDYWSYLFDFDVIESQTPVDSLADLYWGELYDNLGIVNEISFRENYVIIAQIRQAGSVSSAWKNIGRRIKSILPGYKYESAYQWEYVIPILIPEEEDTINKLECTYFPIA